MAEGVGSSGAAGSPGSPGEKARQLRAKALAADRAPEDWVKENRRRAQGSVMIGGPGFDRPKTPLTSTQLADPRDLYAQRVGRHDGENLEANNRRRANTSNIFGGEEAASEQGTLGARPTAERLHSRGSAHTYGNPDSPTHNPAQRPQPAQPQPQPQPRVIDASNTRQLAVRRSRVNGVG